MLSNKWHCPICSNDGFLFIDKGGDYFINKGCSPEFSIYNCSACDLLFSWPSLSLNELADYYPNDYEAYVPPKSFRRLLNRQIYRSDLRRINKYLRRKATSLFEIGAGRGEFLLEASSLGWQIAGVEPSHSAVQYAKKSYGIDLERAFIEEWRFDHTYDVIAMRHTLEHVNKAEEVLRSIFETALPDRGLLYLKLPRADSWEARLFKRYWHGYDLPRHRIHFTSSGIKKLLLKIGFSCVNMIPDIMPLDLVRSVEYTAMKRHLPKLDTTLMPIAQAIALIMSPLGPGRMIVIAEKLNG